MGRGIDTDAPYVIMEGRAEFYPPRVYDTNGVFTTDLSKAQRYPTYAEAKEAASVWYTVNVVSEKLLKQIQALDPTEAVKAEQERIARFTLEYPEGCDDQKRRFIERAGLSIPKRRSKFTVQVEVEHENGQQSVTADAVVFALGERDDVVSVDRSIAEYA
jgi:hypothetical protein